MSELIRIIEQSDIPRIRELINTVIGNGGQYSNIERLGGMTNRSYKVTVDGKEYLVRIPGEGTEGMINRLDERKSTELACKLGIDSPLLFFGDDGTKVMDFIQDPQPMSEEVMKRQENLSQAAELFHRLHTCGEDTGVIFEVFEMAALYEKIIRDGGVALYEDYDNVKQTVIDVKKAIDDMFDPVKVPCHNDSLIGNWVIDSSGKLYLIDWEYSGMNDAMWDLSCLSIEAEYSHDDDMRLLNAYYGRPPAIEEEKRFVAAKLYVDFLWSLWGLTRVPYDGQFMQEYADARYDRLKKNIEYYRTLE